MAERIRQNIAITEHIVPLMVSADLTAISDV